MAAITAGGVTFTTSSGTKTVTATPAVNDLIIIITAHSGNTSATAPTDDNNSGTYTILETAVKNSSGDTMKCWARDTLIGSASSTVFTHAPGASTGGGLSVLFVSGMTLTGSSAKRGSGKEDNTAGGGTPTPVLSAAALTANPVITSLFKSGTADTTDRTGYTRHSGNTYISPNTRLNVLGINSGETNSSLAYGGTSAVEYCDLAVELDSSVPGGTAIVPIVIRQYRERWS